MTNRNTRSGKLAFLLIALVVLAGFQPGPAKTQDLEQLRKAAEQGHPGAQYNLGNMYNNSEGVPQDYVQAHKWVNLAASRTTGEVAENSRILRDKLAEKMTASQIAEAQRLAREWQPKSWEQLKDK